MGIQNFLYSAKVDLIVKRRSVDLRTLNCQFNQFAKDGAQLQERVTLDTWTPDINHCWPEYYKSSGIPARRMPQVWPALPASGREHTSPLYHCCCWRSNHVCVRLREGIFTNRDSL